MLKLSVWMLDDVLRRRPIRGGVHSELVVLICGEQLRAVWVEIGCEREENERENQADEMEKEITSTIYQQAQFLLYKYKPVIIYVKTDGRLTEDTPNSGQFRLHESLNVLSFILHKHQYR